MRQWSLEQQQRIVAEVHRRRVRSWWIAVPIALGALAFVVLLTRSAGLLGGDGIAAAAAVLVGIALHLRNWRCPGCGATLAGQRGRCLRCGAPLIESAIVEPENPAARPAAAKPAKPKAKRPAAPAAAKVAPELEPAAPPLSAVELWALAAGANLTRTRGDRLDRLALGCTPESAAESLGTWWDMHGPADVQPMLAWLRHEGHTTRLAQVLQMLDDFGDGDFEAFVASQDESIRHQLRYAREHRAELKGGALEAFDMVRLSFVARASYTAGWIDERAAWAAVLEAARRLQRAHGSWQEMSQQYLLGRRYWAGGDPAQQLKFDRQAKWLETDPKSPWQQLPWDLPLATIHGVN